MTDLVGLAGDKTWMNFDKFSTVISAVFSVDWISFFG